MHRLHGGWPPGGPAVRDFTLWRCACHSDCALSTGGDVSGWPQRCNCNATLRLRDQGERHDHDEFNLFDALGRGINEASRERRARNAATAGGKGRTRAEVSAIIDEEWARHGLDPPLEAAKSRLIDDILCPAESLRALPQRTE